MKIVLNLFVMILPWFIKRWILISYYHYDIASSAKIGLSYIYPVHLEMDENARIGHLNVAIHLDNMKMGKNTIIARSNWITGFDNNSKTKHFLHQKDTRVSELILNNESAITKKHHLDCTNRIYIGSYVTIAGYNSQLLTHSINVYDNRQDSYPIVIHNYCFISTGVIILGGSVLPPKSILAAGSVLCKDMFNLGGSKLFAGVPAKPIKDIPETAMYFYRKEGIVI
jgi:acetyltransferase-like isoleucine patch superfamily enzyme